MAKSAKDKLAVDGTAKLAAKSKPSDKHEKKSLSIEKATVESPRPSRKRAGDFFDFGDEADRVADDLAADGAQESVAKAGKPNKKPKTDSAEASVKKSGKKGKAGKGDTLKETAGGEDSKTSKSKKVDKPAKENAVDSSVGAATVPAKAPKSVKNREGQSKKAEKVSDKAGDTTEASAKQATKAKKGAIGEVTKPADTKKPVAVEETVASKKGKKQKANKSDDTGKSTDSKVPEVDIAEPEETREISRGVKKGKVGKDAMAKAKSEDTKASKKDVRDAPKKGKSESSKAPRNVGKDLAEPKTTDKNVEPKAKASKNKSVEDSTPASSKPSTKKSQSQSSDKVAQEAVESGKAPKPSKAKNEAKKSIKVIEGEAGSKKAKGSESAKAKKSATSGETAKSKKPANVKTNKSDIADQAIQPMDLVEEEAALQELSKPESSRGKKRKAPSDVAANTLKSDLLDPLSEHAADESAKKKQKKTRKSLGETLGEMVATGADAVRNSFTGILGVGGGDGKPTTTGSGQKQSNGRGKTTNANDPQPTVNEFDEEAGDEDEPDDATAVLLAGFESDGDEVHPPSDAGFHGNNKIPQLPNPDMTSKKLKAIKLAQDDKPGVVYVGRIPHGFYEHEMRTYFSQFGDINRLRLSRSVKTGRSKHYAFLEFKNEDVAKIVAQTMDNYLMFGHILKCKVVAPGDVHESMWKGANKRFKKVPWSKIEGQKLEMPASREVWKKREEKELKKRNAKSKKMMEIVGYEFEGTGLRSVDSVPKKSTAAIVERETTMITADGEEQARQAVISEQVKGVEMETKEGPKISVQSAKAAASTGAKRALDGEETPNSVTKKAKKQKKNVKA